MRSKWILAALAAFALLLAPLVAAAQRPSGAYVNVYMAAAATKYSGASLEAASAGNGFWLTFIAVDDNNEEYALRITDAAVLDENVATVTPTFVYGTVALTTVVKEGRSTTAFGEGDFLVAQFVHYSATSSLPIFVPAGKVLTIQRDTVNTVLDVTLGFMEALR